MPPPQEKGLTMELVYVFDAYCGWSYGFAPTMTELARRHPDLPVRVVSGGLFTGSRRVPIAEFGYVQGANAKITELTGVPFGEAYDRLIADGTFVMDSEAAARGMAALASVAPSRAVELAGMLQEAFYVDGLSLSDASTYRHVAARAGLDGEAVVAAFSSAVADFREARQLGVSGFPTLLAVEDGVAHTLAVGHATLSDVEERLASLGS